MGERKKKRSRIQCVRVYHLSQAGMTHRQIADLIGKRPESIAGMIKVGERWADEVDDDPAPYCSYGHATKAQCDCGPIADNE